MTADQERALLAMMAAQLAAVIEIRDLLLAAVAPVDDAVVFAGCDHPEASRVDLSTISDRNHWVCRECKFDSKAVA